MPSHVTTHNTKTTHYQPGGRVGSPGFWAAKAHAEEFAGLEEGADRYGLLLLAKQAGKLGGFTPRMIQLLEYYLAYTRDIDWEEGGRPIVYQSLSRTALDLGVSERQVQKLEAALFDAGAITWNDSGNHKRYGRRCSDTGRIVYAYGVDLSRLAELGPVLEANLAEKRRRDEAWLASKRAISALRREFRALAAQWSLDGCPTAIAEHLARYEVISVQIRTHLDLERVEALHAEHERLVADLRALVEAAPVQPDPVRETQEGSPKSEPGFAHYKYTTHSSKEPCSQPAKGFQESVAETWEPERQRASLRQAPPIEHVSLGMAIAAAGPGIRDRLPKDPDWSNLVEAAYARRGELGVSQASWAEVCAVLGRCGAAVALLVTDRAASREFDPVRTPPAYFRGMVRRAEAGELRLYRSVFGLLERDRAA